MLSGSRTASSRKAALTELFESLKTDQTPVIVENVVDRIDEVVKAVRFEGWQSTIRGDQEARKASMSLSPAGSRQRTGSIPRRYWPP